MDKDKTLNEQKEKGLRPDDDMLHTTDPEDKMKGPISSIIRKTGHAFETGESKQHANKKHDERW